MDALYAATLTIDLGTVAGNYRYLSDKLSPSGTVAGAAVKADGYGLGADKVVSALWSAGCKDFFVAHPHEGLVVRDVLSDARIHVLNGPLPDAIDDYLAANMMPVLNSLEDIQLWSDAGRARNRKLKADVHIDTGMCRLGLDLGETEKLIDDPTIIDGIEVQLLMSHLATADDPETAQNEKQLKLFTDARSVIKAGKASLCNSSGIFLGPQYHFEVARPGVALYGGNPTPYAENPMGNPVTLTARLLQIRDVNIGETVGYGATHAVTRPSRIATVPVGYADGFHRIGSDIGAAHIAGHAAPITGRVSMDLITLDVTDVPEHLVHQGAEAEFLGEHRTPDDLARDWQTIPYEVLTGLGQRYRRIYREVVS